MNFTVFLFIFSQGLPGPPGEKGENGDVGPMVSFYFLKLMYIMNFHITSIFLKAY